MNSSSDLIIKECKNPDEYLHINMSHKDIDNYTFADIIGDCIESYDISRSKKIMICIDNILDTKIECLLYLLSAEFLSIFDSYHNKDILENIGLKITRCIERSDKND